MSQELSVKYPNSAHLFQFCRRVLDYKFGQGRVIDQDVGQILQFDPADCSHWKKGKKQIRSIQAMKAIADHLDLDEQLVVDVASGNLDDTEAFHEFIGYGAFSLDPKLYETAKKDLLKRFGHAWSREKEIELKKWFTVDQNQIEAVAQKVLDAIHFSEPPLFLPEICSVFPELLIVGAPHAEDLINGRSAFGSRQGEHFVVQYLADMKMGSHLRFSIAKGMAPFFLEKEGLLPPDDLGQAALTIVDVQANIFAAYLLTPTPLLQKELGKTLLNRSIITQLADVFWVSKGFMNQRLKSVLTNRI